LRLISRHLAVGIEIAKQCPANCTSRPREGRWGFGNLKPQQQAIMKKMNRWLATAAVAGAMCVSVNQSMAQQDDGGNAPPPGGGGGFGRGNFDPAQFQQRMLERVRDQLEVKDDAEWKALEPLVQKVMDLRRQVEGDRMRGMFRRGGPRADAGGDQGGRRGGFFGQPSPEAETLTRAIESKASNSELKAALAKFVEARKAKQAELEQAQTDLRKALSLRQEAIATSAGLL
jgi:hypothetical protein